MVNPVVVVVVVVVVVIVVVLFTNWIIEVLLSKAKFFLIIATNYWINIQST